MKRTFIIMLVCILLFIQGLYAQYNISKSVFINGTATSNNSNYILKGTTGNSTTGKSSGVSYNLNSVIFTMTDIEKIDISLPDNYKLFRNYPNPFNPITNIKFQLPEFTHVRLSVYDLTGRLINTIIDENMDAGTYTIKWDASKLNSGVYVIKIHALNYLSSVKCILLK